MDRFIGLSTNSRKFLHASLKSNMDRFIADALLDFTQLEMFKIQYG